MLLRWPSAGGGLGDKVLDQSPASKRRRLARKELLFEKYRRACRQAAHCPASPCGGRLGPKPDKPGEMMVVYPDERRKYKWLLPLKIAQHPKRILYMHADSYWLQQAKTRWFRAKYESGPLAGSPIWLPLCSDKTQIEDIPSMMDECTRRGIKYVVPIYTLEMIPCDDDAPTEAHELPIVVSDGESCAPTDIDPNDGNDNDDNDDGRFVV